LAWALAWAVLFTAMHGYWYLGGTIGLGDAPSPLPGLPTSPAGWVFTIGVAGMFAVGLAAPIVLLRNRSRGGFRRTLVLLLWAGCLVLVLRGGSGLLDDVVRDAGLSSGGITGLSYQYTLGTAHPSTYTLVSTATIDAYFLLGGILYGWAARTARVPATPGGTGGPAVAGSRRDFRRPAGGAIL
jgi:hypothetical protein